MIFMKIRVLGNRRFKNVGQAGVRQERVCRQTEGTMLGGDAWMR